MIYSVKFEGLPWREDDYADAVAGIKAWADCLSSISGLPPEDVFECVFGELTFIAGDPTGKWRASVQPGVPDEITFEPGWVDPLLVQHELGHVFSDLMPWEESPTYALKKWGIKIPPNRLVSGPVVGGHYRHRGSGYKFAGYPALQHPPTWDEGKTANEELPDLCVSLINDNFADNKYGNALRNFTLEWFKRRMENCGKVE
jgi:hypothetical protein